jgi:hypothetical protein
MLKSEVRFSRLIAVFVALMFFVGITQCASLCVGAESRVSEPAPPCHDMGHMPGQDHASCAHPVLVAEQAASVQTPVPVLHALPVQAFHIGIALVRHESIRYLSSITKPPSPPRSTTVLLI